MRKGQEGLMLYVLYVCIHVKASVDGFCLTVNVASLNLVGVRAVGWLVLVDLFKSSCDTLLTI